MRPEKQTLNKITFLPPMLFPPFTQLFCLIPLRCVTTLKTWIMEVKISERPLPQFVKPLEMAFSTINRGY